jgi:hypothetical protein
MAKVTGALLSFGARGQIGKTLVMSKWKGIPYARQHVVPANPKTTAQQTNRKIFAFMRELFKRAPAAMVDAFNAYAIGRPLTGMNKCVGENVRVLQGQTDLDFLIVSPGNGGGLPPITFSAVTGSAAGDIDVAISVPDAPAGWTLTSAISVAVPQQSPSGIFAGAMVSAEDVSTPYAPDLTGLVAGAIYVVGGFLKWTKPDGSIAYSASSSAVATAHA